MAEPSNAVFKYLETILPLQILDNNEELKNHKIVECTAKSAKSFDGFLSSIFQICLVVEDKDNKRQMTLNLIAKQLKRLGQFSEECKLDEMTFNELVFYADILPIFKNLLNDSGSGIEPNFTPKFYYGFFGKNKDLGDGEDDEAVFVFENLTFDGYRMGPRDKLDIKHIMIMTESIAKLHAVSYALKIEHTDKFDKLVTSLRAFPFHEERKSMFDAFYDIALERLLRYMKSTNQPEEFTATIAKLYKKYMERPSKLMQEFLDDDPIFNTIIHGDYNRNNVMFKYETADGFEDPKGVKMFDFQWTKYASPVLDLSFFLYMNLDPEVLTSSWSNILKFYHKTLISSLAKILNCEENDERLGQFNFDAFLTHFSRFAFYGCLIATWFLPAMLADLELIKSIELEINKDMFSSRTKEVCIQAATPDTMKRVNELVKHAYDNGFIKRLLD